jgi:steroid delta-isomerase-like uncharacterized protein
LYFAFSPFAETDSLVSLAIVDALNTATGEYAMSTSQNKELVRHTMNELDQRRLDGVIATYVADAVFHGFAPVTLDVNGYRQTMAALLDAFPDSRFLVHDVIAEGNKVAVRHHMQGTHQAPFQGIPASGKQVRIDAIALFRVEHEKISEIWLNADFLGLLQQLGVVPSPG